MTVMEKLSDIWDDPIHQNPGHLQVFPNRQGFESSQGQTFFFNIFTRDLFFKGIHSYSSFILLKKQIPNF